MISRLIITALMLGLLSGNCFAAEKKELNFGIISTESSQNLRQVWGPLLEAMEKKTGYTVKAFFAPDYAGIVEGMRFGKVDLAWYGNKSAMEAVDRAGGEVFATVVNTDGSMGYYSHLITHKDSSLKSAEDLLKNARDLNFGNGDPNSTSGFLVPGYYVFAKNNVDPKTAFKRVVNANHETNALTTAAKQVDAATSNSEALERLEKAHPDKRALIKIIWTSPLIPSDPLVWRSSLPEETKRAVKDFLLNYAKNSDAEKEVLKGLGWSAFASSDNTHLYPVRQLELFKSRTTISNDGSLSEEKKKAALADIDAKLAAIQAAAK